MYDGRGRRHQKVAGGATHTYVYDDEDIVEERLSSGAVLAHVHGPGADSPLATRDQSGGVVYYLADHLGSIVQTTDGAGQVQATRRYDPWGSPVGTSSGSGYAFTGREWDAETRLYYYRARYYDPQLARFLSEDPLGANGGWNLAAYAANRPVVLTDPTGLKPPQYDPASWNDARWVGRNNCYTYAQDRMNIMLNQQGFNPGEQSGRPFTKMECADIKAAAKRDGFMDPGPKGNCKPNCHLVRLYVTQDARLPPHNVPLGPDYHWYRIDSNGKWSSKHGGLPVGAQITDPDVDAKAWNYGARGISAPRTERCVQ